MADLLKADRPGPKSQAATVGAFDLTEKLNLLAEDVHLLLDRNQTINELIQKVQLNIESVANRVQQIDVSLGIHF